MIRARDNKPVPRIKLDLRSGLPAVLDQLDTKPSKGFLPVESTSEEDRDHRESNPFLLLSSL